VIILNYYRKFIEKSRSFFAERLKAWRNRGDKKMPPAAAPTNAAKQKKNKASLMLSSVRSRISLFLHNYYRKFIEKSKSFFAGRLEAWRGRGDAEPKKNKASMRLPLMRNRIDLFLLITAVAVLIIIAAAYARRTSIDLPKRVDISIRISPQCVDLFGSDIINAFIQEFENRNPDLRIQTAEADQEADIIFFDDEEYTGLINESALVSLSPYIHTEAQGGGWALPLVSFMDIFIYNIDILKAANCDRPPKTRAEFLTVAKAVAGSTSSQRTGQETISPFALGLSQTDPMALRWNFYPWFWANGGDIAAIDASDKIFLDTIAFFKQLNSEGLLAPGTFEKDKARRLQEFAEGKIAMILASARDIALLERNTNGITFGITALPAAALGKNRLGLSSIYAGISSACTLPDEAWIFLAFIAGKKQILAETVGAVPGAIPDTGNGSFPGTFPGEYIEQNPFYSKAWDIFEAGEIIEYRPDQQSDEINNLIRVKLTEALK
jgi:ABC-type glycerol-3-phosphate transport system substrate-binding protein